MLDPETNLVHLCDYAATQKAHVVRSRHMARADKEQQEQVEQDPSKIRKKRRWGWWKIHSLVAGRCGCNVEFVILIFIYKDKCLEDFLLN